MNELTDIQRRVLRGLARGKIPKTPDELDAYVELRDAGLAGYDPAAGGVRPTAAGHKALAQVRP